MNALSTAIQSQSDCLHRGDHVFHTDLRLILSPSLVRGVRFPHPKRISLEFANGPGHRKAKRGVTKIARLVWITPVFALAYERFA